MIRGAKKGDRVKLCRVYYIEENERIWDLSKHKNSGTVVRVTRASNYVWIRVKPDHIDHAFLLGPRDLERLKE